MRQDSGTPLQFGALVLRLLAIARGDPVYAVPFTDVSAITTDCVAGETYAGPRALDAVETGGTVIVKTAEVDAFGTAPFAEGVVGGALPPPLQLATASARRSANDRIRRIIGSAPSGS